VAEVVKKLVKPVFFGHSDAFLRWLQKYKILKSKFLVKFVYKLPQSGPCQDLGVFFSMGGMADSTGIRTASAIVVHQDQHQM
jgi:hypothetical protein